MHKLLCNVQKYGWGRHGHESKVALFKKSQDDTFEINDSETYAELWMGTHSNCPSKIQLETGETKLLSEYIKSDTDKSLGNTIKSHFYTNSGILQPGDLPFLFKVLSINQALSIQAHPNKTLAAQLNKSDPKNYPDSNHKPEMLIAISEQFDALCGFRPIEEILNNFELYPELRVLCKEDNCVGLKTDPSKLKDCFSSLMNQNETIIKQKLDVLINRLTNQRSELEDLFLNLYQQYSNDVGCFSIFLLNFIKLKKGEAIFLTANVPHAYLKGDGVECMACSDNVVRAGLTPKFKDVKVLCEMLDYSMKSVEENKLKGERVNEFVVNFRPSVDEFSLQEIKIESSLFQSKSSLSIPLVDSGSILIVTETNGVHLECDGSKFEPKSGHVYFIDSNKEVNVVKDETESIFVAFKAFCDIKSLA